MIAATPGPLEMLTSWHPHVGSLLALATAGALYAVGWRRLEAARAAAPDVRARRARVPSAWPAWRVAAFAAGLAALAAALLTGVGHYATALLSAHMLQHGLLTMVAPPLLLAGAPLALLLRASPPRTRRRLAAAARSRPARALSRPALGWSLFLVVMVATHLSPVFDAAVRHPLLHVGEHALYVVTGILFWLPLVPGSPVPQRLGWLGRTLYLMLAMPSMAALGVWLAATEAVRYPAYLEPARALGVSAVADQQAAGFLMAIGGSVVMAAAVVILAMEALAREERLETARETYAAGVAAGLPGGQP
jgi:cytochrome c oxidase assembly factor CtaG